VLAKLRAYLKRHHVALLALFVALGGTSYAAINLPRNSVGGKHLKRNAVTSAKVKNRTLKARDFAPRQLRRGRRGPRGRRGAQGLRGFTGFRGPTGSPAGSMILGNTDFTFPSSPSNITQLAPSGFTDAAEVGLDSATSQQISPNATTVVRDLFVRLEAAPGMGLSRQFRLTNHNFTTLIDCTVSGTATTCNSAGDTATVPPGTGLVIVQTSGPVAPAASPGARWSFRTLSP